MSHLSLYFLGSARIDLDGKPIRVKNRKAVALLAYLATTGQSHSRDSLINLLWPDFDSSRGRTTLRSTLYILSNSLKGDRLIADRETIALNPDTDLWVDVDRFRSLLAQCRSHGHSSSEVCPECLNPLNDAVDLYQGDFLTGFGLKDSVVFDDWQVSQTQSLHSDLIGALEKLVPYLNEQEEFEKAISHAQRWLELDRINEEVHRQLMEAYARSGRRASALEQYEECVKVLKEKLGISPQDSTIQLFEAIKENRLPLVSVSPHASSGSEPTPAPGLDQRPPTGTVTFLFTDIEASTQLLRQLGDSYADVLAEHQTLLRSAFQENGGHEVDTQGDSFFVSFATAKDAVLAAISAQKAIIGHPWPDGVSVRVRMGLHTGEPLKTEAGYVGMDVHRSARISSAGQGGQILLSQATRVLVEKDLPEGASLRDLGEHYLKGLQHPEAIFQLLHPDLPAQFPPLLTSDAHPNNLPAQPTPLVGRGKEVETVSKLLLRDQMRLVTLTGPGGTGKTRLGLKVAEDLIDRFSNGVFFVSLAAISDPELVVPTIAHTLGIQETGGQPILQSLKNYLQDKGILLILDNFEQVISASPLVWDLLSACLQLKVLVTSREMLHLQGEHEFPVSPLTLPDLNSLPPAEADPSANSEQDLVSVLSQYEAVELFIQRAMVAKFNFAVTNQNAPAIAEICHRLDGLPLAIELAASRIKLLTPEAILGRLSSRMKLLTGGSRDLPERQQTMRNAIAWSHDLLEESEKILFRRLSAFVGGFTLTGVEAVCYAAGDLELDALDGVTSLVDKSLLRQEASSLEETSSSESFEGEPRFLMLETVREYGLERLTESGEEEETRTNHAAFFLALAEEAEEAFRGKDEKVWLDRLEAEHDNLRGALEWSLGIGEVRARHAVPLRLAGALGRYWFVRGYYNEGRRWLEEALAKSGEASASVQAKALSNAGVLMMLHGDVEESVRFTEKALALERELGNKKGIANLLGHLGIIAARQGDFSRSRTLHEESLSLSWELGERFAVRPIINLGILALFQGDYSRVRELGEDLLALSEKEVSKDAIIARHYLLGLMARNQGDSEKAKSLLEEGLALMRKEGYRQQIVSSLTQLGLIESDLGNFERAATLTEEGLTLSRKMGDKSEVATSLMVWGVVAKKEGDYGRARTMVVEGLTLVGELGNKFFIALCLEFLAGIDQIQKQPERAARLYGVVEALRQDIGTPIPPVDRDDYDRSVAAVRAELGEEAFAAAWAEGRTMTIEDAVKYALKVENF